MRWMNGIGFCEGGCGRWSLVVNDRRVEIVLGRSGSTMGVVLDGRCRWSLALVVGH